MMPGVVTTRLKGFYVVEIAKLKIVLFCKEVGLNQMSRYNSWAGHTSGSTECFSTILTD